MTVMKKGTNTKMKYQQGQTRLSSQYAKRGVSKFTLKTYVSIWGTFHLSELTGQKIPVKMTISLLIKTIQSNPKWHARRKWGFNKNSWKKRFLLSKWLVRLWSGRSVLTFGKGPKGASLNVIVYCQFNKANKTTCDEYVWHSFYNHYSDIFISIILHKAKHTIWRS